MKVYTSYFYQIRFFKSNMVPISTAKFDPAWFHAGKGNDFHFIDKNGVMNGLRAPVFAPGEVATAVSNCGTCDHTNFDNCAFLRAYAHQLSLLDFNDIMARTKRLCQFVKDFVGFEEEPIAVFIVHEAADNPCSERAAIQEYFRSHGIECEEWKGVKTNEID